MKTVELFCGTKSFSKVAAALGHETFTVDIDERFEPDLTHDMLDVMPQLLIDKIKEADIVWMSPPCTTFSMAAGNKHWSVDRKPKTIEARMGLQLLEICRELSFNCKIWFIENPRARARWFLPEETRHTVWYCQYGDHRAKPTDIWTNLRGWTPKQCSNNNPDCHHDRSPRGSKTGTQGKKDATARGEIPPALIKELLEHSANVNLTLMGVTTHDC